MSNTLIKDKETSSVEIQGKKYCAYCLEPMRVFSYSGEGLAWDVHTCQCAKAQAEAVALHLVQSADEELTDARNQKLAYTLGPNAYALKVLELERDLLIEKIEKTRHLIREGFR